MSRFWMTDNATLAWLDKFRDEKVILLRDFQFDVEHVPGKTNELPDALSHFRGDERGMEYFLPQLGEEHDESVVLANVFADVDQQRVIATQQNDAWLNEVYFGGRGRRFSSTKGRKRAAALEFASILCFYHNDDLTVHPGSQETLRAVGSRFYWPSMRRDVRRHVTKCRTCAKTKAARS
jgi:hypothetical protein